MAKRKPWEKYKLVEPRKEKEVVFQCFADPRMFAKNFEDMPKSMQKIFGGEDGISLPCDAGGGVGSWCQKCVFGNCSND